MPRYNLAPIVRPSDLRGRSIPSHVAEAVRTGRARLVGFESEGQALFLLKARERMARDPSLKIFEVDGEPVLASRQPRARCPWTGQGEPARRWSSLADALEAEGAYPAGGGRGRGGGVTGPSRGGA